MSQKYLPEGAEEITVVGATVPFYKYTDEGITYYQFDTSLTGPPEPMVNAMCGLKLITSPEESLNMINHKKPMGLLDRIGENFDIEIVELEKDLYKVIFSFKGESTKAADLNASHCHG